MKNSVFKIRYEAAPCSVLFSFLYENDLLLAFPKGEITAFSDKIVLYNSDLISKRICKKI